MGDKRETSCQELKQNWGKKEKWQPLGDSQPAWEDSKLPKALV